MHIQHGDHADPEQGQCSIAPFFPAPFDEDSRYKARVARDNALKNSSPPHHRHNRFPMISNKRIGKKSRPLLLMQLSPKARETLFAQYFLGGYYVSLLGDVEHRTPVPALLITLQSLPKTYSDALRVFFDVTDFWIRPFQMNNFLHKAMIRDMQSLRKMTFNFSPDDARHPKDLSDPKGVTVPLSTPSPEKFMFSFMYDTMLRELTIVIGKSEMDSYHVLNILNNYSRRYPCTLQRFNLRIDAKDIDIVEEINQLFQIPGKTERVSGWTSKIQFSLPAPRKVNRIRVGKKDEQVDNEKEQVANEKEKVNKEKEQLEVEATAPRIIKTTQTFSMTLRSKTLKTPKAPGEIPPPPTPETPELATKTLLPKSPPKVRRAQIYKGSTGRRRKPKNAARSKANEVKEEEEFVEIPEDESDEEREVRRQLGYNYGHHEKNIDGFWFVDTWFWEAKKGETLFDIPPPPPPTPKSPSLASTEMDISD